MKPRFKAAKLRLHVKAWFCGSAFYASTLWGAAATVGEAPAQPVHPLVGAWRWSVFDGKCVETWRYRADGVVLGTSGEAVTEGTYTISLQASSRGFYKVEQMSVRQNGKKDCSGDIAQEAATSITSYIQFSPARDRYIACKAESLTACFGPLQRVR